MNRPQILYDNRFSVPEHQILLSFVNDTDAEQFEIWWNMAGWKKFNEWTIKQAKQLED